MSDPISLVPLPRSVVWSSGTWESPDPWSELSVGISTDLSRTEYALEHVESPDHLARLTRDGAGEGHLEVDSLVASRVEAHYVLDVTKPFWVNVHVVLGIGLGTLMRFVLYRTVVFGKAAEQGAPPTHRDAHEK